MVVPHRSLNPDIDNAYIDKIADREGYDKFMPYTFIKHLAYAFSFHIMGQTPTNCISEKSEYTEEFAKLLSFINYEKVKTYDPVVFAIRTLSIFYKKVNLRALENSAKTLTTFVFEEEDRYQNYSFDLNSLSSNQLDVLGVQSGDPETMVLPDDVEKILRFYDGLLHLKPIVDPVYDVVKEQIRSFSDFSKVRRYKFALPSFKADLGMKKLQITKVSDSEEKVSEAIIAIDFSYSMGKSPLAIILIRSVLLYYLKELSDNPKVQVTILKVLGRISDVISIKSEEELKRFILTPPTFILPSVDTSFVFNDLNNRYAGRTVVFLSDGLIDLKAAIPLKFKLHSVTTTPNPTLQQMSTMSGGQFIVLK